MIVAEIKPFSS